MKNIKTKSALAIIGGIFTIGSAIVGLVTKEFDKQEQKDVIAKAVAKEVSKQLSKK